MSAAAERILIVHTFAPVAADAYQGLREAWQALCGEFVPIEGVGPCDLPVAVADLPTSGLVAVRLDPPTNDQAFVHRRHDALFLSVALAVRDDWDRAEHRWSTAAGDVEAWTLGEVRLFVSYESTASVVTLQEEADDAPDGRRLRRIRVTAPNEGDLPKRTEGWVWQESRAAPAPLTRYLAQAAKIRHQLRVYERAGSNLEVSAVVDAALAALDARTSTPGDLTAWHSRLLALTSGANGLVERIIGRQEMRHTVRITVANMEWEIARIGRHGSSRLFADDLALAHWFADLLGDTITYLELNRDRVRDALTTLTVQAEIATQEARELSQAREAASQRRRDHVNLLQGAMIGAVLMTLAAIQSFEYKVGLNRAAIGPLIAVLSALALWLATLVLVLSAPDGRGWRSLLGAVSAGLLAAAGAWLVATLLAGGPTAPLLTTVVVAPAFGLGLTIMYRLTRSLARST
ncbi:CATRA conflict system CASPASE/TPR repeat-associated protein [Nonomuraea sp. NPDC050790]|uniref:CATRA conflict system CASPASE/TPR repeat-associated protein n=1 Tax=Nonomuraea sp. NPDC050790 TaxID=3364371 RepID=UPI0037984F08